MSPILLLPVFVGGFTLLFVIVQYNALVSLRNHIRESWSDVDTELQRRHELIPNLVAVVKGYAAHERAVFAEIAEFRRGCLDSARTPGALSAREHALARATARMLAISEAYPEIKADSRFLSLHRELVETENRIQSARRFYNGNVREYRNKCELFPSNLVAAFCGFESCDYFQSEPSAHRAPRVSTRRDDHGLGEIDG